MGLLVEALRDAGVDASGIDVSEYAITHVDEIIRDHCRVGSLTDPLGDESDLIICLETLEHLEAPDAEVALDNLCGATDRILFSSSPSDFGEPTHVNLHPPEVWSVAFARRGFFRDVDYDASFLRHGPVLYRQGAPDHHELVRAYDRVLGRVQLEANEVRRQLVRLHEHQEEEQDHVVEIEGLRSRVAELEDEADRAEGRGQVLAAAGSGHDGGGTVGTGWSAVGSLRRHLTRS